MLLSEVGGWECLLDAIGFIAAVVASQYLGWAIAELVVPGVESGDNRYKEVGVVVGRYERPAGRRKSVASPQELL